MPSTYLPLLLLLSSLLLAFPPPAYTQHLENDLQALLHDLDGGGGGGGGGGGAVEEAGDQGGDDDFEVELLYRPDADDAPLLHPSSASSSSSSRQPSPLSPVGVRRLWGVEDTQAFVGRLFSHPIPKDAFQGEVESYQVKGLPAWLSWDAARGSVEGVARPSDRGHHYVTVRAKGVDGSHAKDVFAVDVVPLPGSVLSHEGGGCGGGRGGRGGRGGQADVTVLTVLLHAHLSSLPVHRRLKVLREANKFMGLNASLVPAPHDSDPLADDSALQAGPGSARITHASSQRSLSQLQWVVGCGGDVRSAAQPDLDRIEVAAKNGELEALLGLPVMGWHVTQVNPTSNRVRRQADYSGDYGVGIEEGGDGSLYDAEYENYDDNYDYEDYIYGGPLEEETGNVLNFGDYGTSDPVPETRVIPSLATPTFPEPSSVASASVPQGSRVHPDSALHFTPVLVSTPVYVPEKPTRILEASPTVTYESAYPTGLPYPGLEGSMTNQPTSAITSTTPLSVTPVTTQPIAPTSVKTHTETESVVRNYPPRIANRIQKVAWIAGHVYRLPIPADTFEDFEDGDTKNLRLHFKTSHGLNVGYNSWIQFDPSKQEIYALPLESDIGRYSYFLEAMDSEGKTATDTVIIHVQQPRQGRNYNHRFTAVFTPEKKFAYDFVYSLDWQIKVVEKLATLYGDPTTDNINVRSISENPTKMAWTNTSLANPRSTQCPSDELEAVAEVVVSGDDHGMTREVKEAFKPEFHLKKVHLHYMGACEELRPSKPVAPGPPSRPRPPIPPPVEPVDVTGDELDTFNREPIMRNPIDLLNATAGSLFRFQVPEDTCYDLEDGDSHKLRMRLLTSTLADIPEESWLQFEAANHEFFGVPLAGDVGKTEYNLECVDSGGKKVIDALFVSVMRKPSRGLPAAQFGITIQEDYREFTRNAKLKARLVERIAQAFGDPNPQYIAIDDISEGSVVVLWHNTSLPSDPCPEEDLNHLREVMLDTDGQLLPSFVEAFAPEYTVTSGSLTPAGVCLGGDTPTHIEEEVHKPEVDDSIKGEDNEYLINFIIPAVIIAAMLFLAAIIACCLYHRRRYGKMTMADDRTFVSKGIPIIFAEELDDRPDPAKSPVIMKEEKPPLPPPEYQRGSPAAPATPPNTDRRRPQSGGEGGDDTPSYQPPPPFTATNGASRHPRPNMPPTYRKPPTYVPP